MAPHRDGWPLGQVHYPEDMTHGEIGRALERLESGLATVATRVRRMELALALAVGAGTAVGSGIGATVGSLIGG